MVRIDKFPERRDTHMLSGRRARNNIRNHVKAIMTTGIVQRTKETAHKGPWVGSNSKKNPAQVLDITKEAVWFFLLEQ
jgi:predicted transcriptional regulator